MSEKGYTCEYCEICGREMDHNELWISMTDDNLLDFDSVCEGCAKKLLDKYHGDVTMMSYNGHAEQIYRCSHCHDLFIVSDLRLVGEPGDVDYMCKGCIETLLGEGKHLRVHY